MQLFHWHSSSPSRHAIQSANQERTGSHNQNSGRAVARRLVTLCFIFVIGFTSLPVQAQGNEPTAVDAAFGIEYAVPNGPRNLTEEAPGRIWYTATEAGGIGFLEVTSDPGDPVIRYRTEFYGLGELPQPYDLVYSNGVVWFTLRGIRSLGRIDVATREIKTYPLLSVGAAPTGIDVDNVGRLWIAQHNGRISRFDPTTETFIEFVMPSSLAVIERIEDIDYYDDRNIWFTMPDAHRIVHYNAVLDNFFSRPIEGLRPMGIAFDPDGSLWFTAAESSTIVRYTYTTNSIFFPYDSPTPNSGPTGIIVFKDALGSTQVWVTENTTGTIGRMQMKVTNNHEVVSTERVGPTSPVGNTWGIIRTSDEHIRVADEGRNLLYELTQPYIHQTYMASIVSPESPPPPPPPPPGNDEDEDD